MEPHVLLQTNHQELKRQQEQQQQQAMVQLQPGLAQSVTEEDDLDDSNGQPDLHNALVEEVRSMGGGAGDRIALSYLLRYETMVRQQEAEEMATLAHLRPLLERIQVISGGRKNASGGSNNSKTLPQSVSLVVGGDDYASLANEISFKQLKRALEALKGEHSTEVMTTDRQLMMMLRLLTQKTMDETEETISWGELVMMYKICVLGMLTLQHMPSDTLSRNRTRERTIALMSLFEPPSTKLFNEGMALDIEAFHASNRSIPRDVVLEQQLAAKRNSRRQRVVAILFVLVAILGAVGTMLPREVMSGLADVVQTVVVSFGQTASKPATPATLQGPSKRDITKATTTREIPKVLQRETVAAATVLPLVSEIPEPSPLIDFFSPVSHQPPEHAVSHTPPSSRQQYLDRMRQLPPSPRIVPLRSLPVAKLEDSLPSRTTIVHVQGTANPTEAQQLPAALGVVVGAVSVAAVPSVMAAVQTMIAALHTSSTLGVVGVWAVTTILVVSAATKSFQWLWALLTGRRRNRKV